MKNIYWRDLAENADVVDKGTHYTSGRKVVYWNGHEATAALNKLGQMARQTRLIKNVRRLK